MLRVAMSRVLTPASFVWSEMVSDCVVRLSDALTRIMMARAVVPRKACVRKAHVAVTPTCRCHCGLVSEQCPRALRRLKSYAR